MDATEMDNITVRQAIRRYDRLQCSYFELKKLINRSADCGVDVEIVQIPSKANGPNRQVLLSASEYWDGHEYCIEGRLFTPDVHARLKGLMELTSVHDVVSVSSLARRKRGIMYFSDLRSVTILSPTDPIGGLKGAIDRYDLLIEKYPRPDDDDDEDTEAEVKYTKLKRVGMLQALAAQAEEIITLLKDDTDGEMVRIMDSRARVHDVLLYGSWKWGEYMIAARRFPTPGHTSLDDLAEVIETCRNNLLQNWHTHVVTDSRLAKSVRQQVPGVRVSFSDLDCVTDLEFPEDEPRS